jgi:lipopolysaccharide/colanic/teichoic acid biosynthesis glycosyltransferase
MEELNTRLLNRISYGVRASFLSGLGENIFNVFAAILLLFVFSPVIVMTSILILVFTGFPILYKQERIGQNGIPFVLYKFRTMYNGSDPLTPTRVHDKRVTLVGRFIRKYYLDEMPQILNVILRNMNFVGPRPERPIYVKEFVGTIPDYNLRHQVKPGITGWQQVNSSYSFENIPQKQAYDMYYIDHRSVIFDLYIVLRTFLTILSGSGRF